MKSKSPITTHVLDLATGKPGSGILVTLEKREESGVWTRLSISKTNADGRVEDLLPVDQKIVLGRYRLTFDVDTYQSARGIVSFFPETQLVFEVRDSNQHYHVPLLLSPYGYSTYRGS